MKRGSKLTAEEYLINSQKATRDGLTKLLSSPEYAKWLQTKHIGPKSTNKWALLLVCVLTTGAVCWTIKNSQPMSETSNINAPLQASFEQLQGENYKLLQQREILQAQLARAGRQLNAVRHRLNIALMSPVPIHEIDAVQMTNKTTSSRPQTSGNQTEMVYFALFGFVTLCLVAVIMMHRATLKTANLKAELQGVKSLLDEAIFDKGNAEQMLSLLEGELQRKLKQLAEAQQKPLARLASPRTMTTPRLPPASPNTPARFTSTPGKGELPPPPSALVERFLEERNAVAVEEEQIIAWLEMEAEFEKVQEELRQLRMIPNKENVTEVYAKDDGWSSPKKHGKRGLKVDIANIHVQHTQAKTPTSNMR